MTSFYFRLIVNVALAEEKADVELQLKLQKAKIVEMKKKKAEKADIRTAESTLKKLQDQLDSMVRIVGLLWCPDWIILV